MSSPPYHVRIEPDHLRDIQDHTIAMGNSLTRDTANIKFREQLRRTSSHSESAARAVTARIDVIMNEATPLIGTIPGTAASRNTSHSTLWHVLLDRKHTPGRHDERLAVRWLARLWHIAKISLYSSRCPI